MPKSQLARIYRFLPRGKRKLKLRFLLGVASRPSDSHSRPATPRRSAHHRAECAVRRGVAAISVCVYEERPANSLGAEINTTLHSLPPRAAASGVTDCACREKLPMKVSPNERRERKGERRSGGDERNRDRREQNREQSVDGNEENLPRRVSPKSDAFFQFSCRGVATTSPSQPTLYSSHSQVFWSFEQAGALLFLPIFVILLPCSRLSLSLSLPSPLPSPFPSVLLPFSILPSFMFFRPLSSLGCFHIDK